ncbi:EthD domain-containing protein [Nitrobacteraceae bacterium UC4446_H13]
MIRLIVCMKKLPNLSSEEFRRFWLEEHGPLVRKNATARRIRRYTQIHPYGDEALMGIVERRGGHASNFDGLAEICWDSVDDILAAAQTPEGAKAAEEIVEHERQFLDLPNLEFFLGEEFVLIEGSR